ncbi:Ca2+-transporting ATPase [Flavobacterium swingsii]|jgi:Ca2+-transporting ATPase|uniref:Ca2+-transporting ATPase n=1 Tax=Flavobacterium swingsii TaxID=498292 RepID=A0A1I0WUZ6_9FLAO|nr:cation-translocating P-type ATPase [Flavobacterium swingsii]SFA92384.1 Ca2+-transporting ATPase [Flavobacterium swingsii]
MSVKNFNIKGLTDEEVVTSKMKYGSNVIKHKRQSVFFDALKKFATDPMIILLFVASFLYFINGKTVDGIFLALAIVLVSSISMYQESRSRNALEKLKRFTQPNCKVVRNGKITEIKSEDLVIDDSLIVEEGTLIMADGTIIHSNDFSVNEAILTGESFPVYKEQSATDNMIFQGTTVATGLAIAMVAAIGGETKLGKIGQGLEAINEEKTPLENQISNFVKKMALVGVFVFLIVWSINYFQTHLLFDSLLKSLTLAMSILPEEIPVAFATFMALGAWRMMQMGIVVKQMKTVETLGSATVICVDKTGTITENKMSLVSLFTLKSLKINAAVDILNSDEKELIQMAMWASEPIPFDPMEVALHDAYAKTFSDDERKHYSMVHEYPLSGKPPMMTHIFKDNNANNRIIAAKGAPEAIINLCGLTEKEKSQIVEAIKMMASEGYRILAVAKSDFKGDNYPKTQQEFSFAFKGLVAFYDPPKENIQQVLQHFYKAGINVKIITGDNVTTTMTIAKQIGFKGFERSITGDELMKLSDEELKKMVQETYIFSRMFPEAKLRIIEALKSNNEIVAMTGDGVNDGPALKASHIGIAMGKKGTEIAKQTASLILIDDDLSKMVDAVAMGRKIYANLKKAIQFIISIHIPIILIVFIPLALGWVYPNIFSPIHIIFLELIMGPTCSIVYENEPIETNAMLQKPRLFTSTFFNWKELSTSIIQGLFITIGVLLVYQVAIHQNFNESITRTMVFSALITANIFLTLMNRSFYYSIITTMKYKNDLVLIIIGLTTIITGLLIYVEPLTKFFEFERLNTSQLYLSVGIGFLSVIWYELIKLYKRKYQNLFSTALAH